MMAQFNLVMAVLLAFLVLGVDLQGMSNPLPGVADSLPGFLRGNSLLGLAAFVALAYLLVKVPLKAMKKGGALGVSVD